jgi:VIT1/CCC1 family predicted Fe2+/Mn2+ transporter
VDPGLAIKCGIATFISFMIFGIMPIIPYLISTKALHSENHQFVAAIVIGGVSLFSLGFAKAKLIGLNPFKSAF